MRSVYRVIRFWAMFLVAAWAGMFLPGCCGAAKPAGLGESDALQTNKQIAASVTHRASLAIVGLVKDVSDENALIDLIRKFIAPVRFYDDNSGYFYVYNYDCVNIAHATQKDLPGKNLTDHKDTKGKFVIRELSAAAKQGGGYVEFYWVKPGDVGEHRKLGYVEPIPNTDYFIGTGVYIPESK